ncbi:hypothetical protein M2432_004699 [Mycobacterium sp. OTB74]|jgi:hypothetical protein|nr:hypothetical protein [Mycobacterium sp. OTB74]
MFDLELTPASTAGHNAVAADGRTVEIKATYGNRSVGIRATSDEHAQALVVLKRLPEKGCRQGGDVRSVRAWVKWVG